jgi:uncharacterized membrane protein YeiB
MKKNIVIFLWILLYASCLGFVLPFLFSAKSHVAVISGVLLIILLIIRMITFSKLDEVKSRFNKFKQNKTDCIK